MANKLSKVMAKSKGGKQKPVPVKIVSESGPVAVADDNKWRARHALDTLAEADRIRKDKPLMRAVKAEAREKMKQLSTVCK